MAGPVPGPADPAAAAAAAAAAGASIEITPGAQAVPGASPAVRMTPVDTPIVLDRFYGNHQRIEVPTSALLALVDLAVKNGCEDKGGFLVPKSLGGTTIPEEIKPNLHKLLQRLSDNGMIPAQPAGTGVKFEFVNIVQNGTYNEQEWWNESNQQGKLVWGRAEYKITVGTGSITFQRDIFTNMAPGENRDCRPHLFADNADLKSKSAEIDQLTAQPNITDQDKQKIRELRKEIFQITDEIRKKGRKTISSDDLLKISAEEDVHIATTMHTSTKVNGLGLSELLKISTMTIETQRQQGQQEYTHQVSFHYTVYDASKRTETSQTQPFALAQTAQKVQDIFNATSTTEETGEDRAKAFWSDKEYKLLEGHRLANKDTRARKKAKNEPPSEWDQLSIEDRRVAAQSLISRLEGRLSELKGLMAIEPQKTEALHKLEALASQDALKDALPPQKMEEDYACKTQEELAQRGTQIREVKEDIQAVFKIVEEAAAGSWLRHPLEHTFRMPDRQRMFRELMGDDPHAIAILNMAEKAIEQIDGSRAVQACLKIAARLHPSPPENFSQPANPAGPPPAANP